MPRKGHEVQVMNKWFYAKDGQAIGPLSTPEMHELISQGACTRTTLVWTRGMRDWLPACMADWMWEERAERRDVTPEGEGDHAHAHRHAAQPVVHGSAEEPHMPGMSQDDHAAPVTGSNPPAGDGQGTMAEGGEAGVVGMVRKLFGLG